MMATELVEALGKATPVEPEWLRVPDAATFCGVSQRTIADLCRAKRIKSRLLKVNPANAHGMRIIYLPSLRAYIESCPE